MLGYDPAAVFSGRSPLEAASIGVELGPDDVSYRCNLVTVADGVMKDHTAGHIGNDEARRCVEALQAALGGGPFEFHTGVSYRNLLVWRGGELVPCTPPHDILDRPVAGYLPGVAAGDAPAPARRRRRSATCSAAPTRCSPTCVPARACGSGARARRRACRASATSTGSAAPSSAPSTWCAASAGSPAST